MPDVYGKVAISLHWAVAVLIVAAIAISEAMPTSGARDPLYALHASLGMAILLLSMTRLVWRLTHVVPSYPSDMPGWQKFLARAMSVMLYVLMIGVPLTSWLAHSAEAVSKPFFVNIDIFGLMPLPILRFIEFDVLAFLRTPLLKSGHGLINDLIILLIVLHAGAALKHHIVDRDDVLTRMLPGKKR